MYGAFVVASNKKGNASLDAQANNNKVNLSGGTVTGDVYGGYSIKMTNNHSFITNIQYGWSFETVASTASNNQVNISGTVDVSKANLYGNNGGEGTGNTLTSKVAGMAPLVLLKTLIPLTLSKVLMQDLLKSWM